MSDALVPAVLRAYADLSAASGTDRLGEVARSEDSVTLGVSVRVDGGSMHETLSSTGPLRSLWPALTRLSKLDALHADEQLLRQGWVTLVGAVEIGGSLVPVRQPIVSRPIRLRPRSTVGRIAANFVEQISSDDLLLDVLGEFELTPLVANPDRRTSLLIAAEFGRGGLVGATLTDRHLRRFPALTTWIHAVGEELGERRIKIVPPTKHLGQTPDRPGLVAVVEQTLYLSREVNTLSQRDALLSWISRPGLEQSALAAVLGPAARGTVPSAPDDRLAAPEPAADLESPMLLSPSQREIVRRTRTEPVTVVSGPPGSGKSHTVCAVALDAVASGHSVLIATQSSYASDVVSELLRRTPGPEPVRFGNGAGMAGLIDELTDRLSRPLDPAEVSRLQRDLELARAQVAGLRTAISDELQLELDADSAARWQDALPALIAAAPGLFEVDSDLDHAAELLRGARSAADRAGTGGPVRRWTARRARARLDRGIGSRGTTELERLELALDAARSGRAAATLAARGGVRIGDRWERLEAAEHQLRDAFGRRVRARPFESSAMGAASRAALSRLIAALRAGRGRRRELLAEMDPGQLTAIAPLWVGTLSEIEDVLPAVAGLFDLVILDEASQIEQSKAAPAWLRARRTVVVGDPYQLRHVSFQGDDRIDAVLAANGLERLRGVLDVRRVSAFDLAAASGPVDQLRDHFRSVPHLIEFSVRRFYRDKVDIMTRHPANEATDAIDVVATDPAIGLEGNVHTEEVDAVVALVRSLHAEGATSVGVISPFRDQADALERALVTSFSAVEISQLSLRVGTVHAFQGGERDVIIASLASGIGDSPGRRRFLENPNLFNVMITRARQRMVLVTSLPDDTPGMLGDYLRYGLHALAPPSDAGRLDGWPAELASELRRNGEHVRTCYPVGPWHLDLSIGDGDQVRSLECRVDEAGTAAHIDRHLALRQLGWTLVDAYRSRWDGDAVRAALELRDRT